MTQAFDGPEDDKPMPLLDHLIELRKRLIYALICFFAVFFVTFYFAKPIFSFFGKRPPADLIIMVTPGVRRLVEVAGGRGAAP